MGLEEKVGRSRNYEFKSQGERRIAYFLDGYDIRYRYEPGVLVNSTEGKQRIWYIDFYLPEFAVYIEYFGLAGNHDYDQGIRKKQRVYSEMGFDVISIYPRHFRTDWQGYIMDKLYQITHEREDRLEAKLYRAAAQRGIYGIAGKAGTGYLRSPGGKYRS